MIKDKRYREKSGKKYREFIKELKKKPSKKEENTISQDLESGDNPISTINTHLEDNVISNNRKHDEMNSNLSIHSSESITEFKKEMESLLFSRINTPASSNKNILLKLEMMQKILTNSNENRYYEVKIVISYRQLVNEIVPLLNNFSHNNNSEISKKVFEISTSIKTQVFSSLFDCTAKINELNFSFDIEKFDKDELFKLIDNNLLIDKKKVVKRVEATSDIILGCSSINDNSSDAPQDFSFDFLKKRDSMKVKTVIFPLFNNQIYYLLKELIPIDNINCEEFIEKLKNEVSFENLNKNEDLLIPENKLILRKNICIHLLNIFEKLVK